MNEPNEGNNCGKTPIPDSSLIPRSLSTSSMSHTIDQEARLLAMQREYQQQQLRLSLAHRHSIETLIDNDHKSAILPPLSFNPVGSIMLHKQNSSQADQSSREMLQARQSTFGFHYFNSTLQQIPSTTTETTSNTLCPLKYPIEMESAKPTNPMNQTETNDDKNATPESYSLLNMPNHQKHPSISKRNCGASDDNLMIQHNNVTASYSVESNKSEFELYKLLKRANLLQYFATFLMFGGDDVQQLSEADEEEFLEIMNLVGMTRKPLHVRRLQRALIEWREMRDNSPPQSRGTIKTNPTLDETPSKSLVYGARNHIVKRQRTT